MHFVVLLQTGHIEREIGINMKKVKSILSYLEFRPSESPTADSVLGEFLHVTDTQDRNRWKGTERITVKTRAVAGGTDETSMCSS